MESASIAVPEPKAATSAPERAGLLAQIGNTPLVPIRKLCPNPNVRIFAKLERCNPGGSVKDRIALSMIEAAEQSGELTHDKTILEATSGNTGIGLAMIAAAKGYAIALAMSESVSIERRKILGAYGAEFMLTPGSKGTDGAIEHAYDLINEQPERYFLSDQYNNPANFLAHYHGTAPEIWAQTGGALTHFVAAMGTTGTVVGCSKRFRELNPKIRVIGVEPYLGHRLQGLKNLKEAYVPGIYDPSALDQKVNIEDEAAWEMTRRLAREEALLVGMSSGAAMSVAYELAQRIESGVIVVLFPDGGERYLSTPLFQVAVPDTARMKLHFMNSLTRHYEGFEPSDKAGAVTMYSCGPTAHRRPHLGLLRRMVVDDLVHRTVAHAGFAVKHVVSITDVDDFTVREAERTGEPLKELCKRHEAEFHDDMRALRVTAAEVYAHSSEHVTDMAEITRALVNKGYAYELFHSVYFNVARLERYGELSGQDRVTRGGAGQTVDQDRYEGANPRDFPLFRRSDLGEIRKGLSIKTEWGSSRPSWHIQCLAMSRAHLGECFDIHMGSTDLLFPHHENEIAQSRALCGKAHARYWLHSELVYANDRPITYDGDTYVTLPDLCARGFSARDVRFFFLQTHYRQPLHLTDDKLAAARSALGELDAFIVKLESIDSRGPRAPELEGWLARSKEACTKAMFDDLNTTGALAALTALVNQVSRLIGEESLCRDDAQAVVALLGELDGLFAILPER